MEKYLWNFTWDEDYGMIEGMFVATEDEVNELIGKEVYFGEILGKHSEVYGTIEHGEITKIDIYPDIVEEIADKLGDTWCGYNPLEYANEE